MDGDEVVLLATSGGEEVLVELILYDKEYLCVCMLSVIDGRRKWL